MAAGVGPAQRRAAGPAVEQARGPATAVGDGVFVFRWQAHNALLVRAPAGVVAVDPISVEAARTATADRSSGRSPATTT